jgi:hypothetical protein
LAISEADLEGLGDLRSPHALCFQLAHLGHVDRRGPPLVDPGRLGLRDALKLPFAPQVGLELGEHPEHVEEALAGRGAGVDRLLGRLQ